jgi:hypothetical protein
VIKGSVPTSNVTEPVGVPVVPLAVLWTPIVNATFPGGVTEVGLAVRVTEVGAFVRLTLSVEDFEELYVEFPE